MKRRTLLAALAAAPALPMITACGGGGDEGTVSLRFVNASSGYATLDLFLDGDAQISGVRKGRCSGYVNVESEEFDASVRSGGSGIRLAELDVQFSSETHYTLIAHGSNDNLKLTLLTEDNGDADDGYARLRVFNAATDAGSLDVRLGAVGSGSLDTLVSGAFGVGQIGEFEDIGEGRYRMQATVDGDESDVRLDIDEVALRDGQVATLVLVPSLGGALVNALLLTETGEVVTYANDQARLRVVAGISGGTDPRVAVRTDDGQVLTSSMSSPTVGAYALVRAGAVLTISAAGAAVDAPGDDLEAGGDYSIVVFGVAGDERAILLVDDNRAPEVSSRARLRAVHVSAQNAALTMNVDVDAVNLHEGISYGSASGYASVTPPTSGQSDIEVAVGSTLVAGRDATPSLKAGATYTLFLLDGTGADGTGTTWELRQDQLVSTGAGTGSSTEE